MRVRVVAGALLIAALAVTSGCSSASGSTGPAASAGASGGALAGDGAGGGLAGDGSGLAGGSLAGDGSATPGAGDGVNGGGEAPGQSSPTPTTPLAPTTVAGPPTTVVVTPTGPTLVPPPPSTSLPTPTAAACPYLTLQEVEDANGQHVGKADTIAVAPYPICRFYRPDGTIMAVTRVIQAATPAAAAAAVNQHVPIAKSFAVSHPAGWTGGAMATPDGVPGYPDAGSIYAVSKGDIAVIAISNQDQSIKGRQMAIDVIANLKL